jgi:hypothetical protein
VAKAAPPKAGDRVEAELLAEKTKNGGWKARHCATGLAGPIVNTADVPADRQAGMKLPLIVAAVTAASITFRYPTAADEARKPPKQGPGTPQRGGRGGPPRRGR